MNILKMLNYQGKKTMFKEIILPIKYNGRKIFVAVEKEVGKYKNSAFLLMKPIMRIVVRE